jgi:hypothetical protein
MRQVHRPGEKLFVDYSGKKPRICDPETGEVREVELTLRGTSVRRQKGLKPQPETNPAT